MKCLLFVFSFVILQSCVGEKSTLRFTAPTLENQNSGLSDAQKVAFDNLQDKIMKPKNCLQCHKSFNTKEGLAPLFTGGSPETSKLFLRVEDGTMPKGGNALTTAELEIVREYINAFDPAPNPGGNNPEDDDDIVSFKTIHDKILVPHCIQCHSKTVTEERLVSKWVDQEDPMNSKFIKVVKSGSMPKGAAPLSAGKQKLIRAYLSTFLK